MTRDESYTPQQSYRPSTNSDGLPLFSCIRRVDACETLQEEKEGKIQMSGPQKATRLGQLLGGAGAHLQ